MAPRTRTLLAALGLAVLLTGALTGCATGPGGAPTAPAATTDDTDDTDDGAEDADLSAAWLDGGRMVGIVTVGSSTCVPTAGDVTLEGAVLSVTLVEPV